MRFIFDFEKWTWANLRISIRRLGANSVWFKTLDALLGIFTAYAEKASWIYIQIWLDTATENGLDLWGRRYGVSRYNNELDSDYKIRILERKVINTSGVSLYGKRQYIASILGVDVSLITITKNTDLPKMSMGGAIGRFVGSRNYTIYGYTIRIPFLITDAIKRQRMIDLVMATNIGGNYPVFVELVDSYEPAYMGSVMGSVVRSRHRDIDNGVYSVY